MAKLKKYIVKVGEMHVQPYEVRAASKAQAIAIVERNKEDEFIRLEDQFYYSYTTGSDKWIVEETK